jgi:hypothetical protein
MDASLLEDRNVPALPVGNALVSAAAETKLDPCIAVRRRFRGETTIAPIFWSELHGEGRDERTKQIPALGAVTGSP